MKFGNAEMKQQGAMGKGMYDDVEILSSLPQRCQNLWEGKTDSQEQEELLYWLQWRALKPGF